MFIDIDAIIAEIADCTMHDEVAQRLGQPVKTVLGLDLSHCGTACFTGQHFAPGHPVDGSR